MPPARIAYGSSSPWFFLLPSGLFCLMDTSPTPTRHDTGSARSDVHFTRRRPGGTDRRDDRSLGGGTCFERRAMSPCSDIQLRMGKLTAASHGGGAWHRLSPGAPDPRVGNATCDGATTSMLAVDRERWTVDRGTVGPCHAMPCHADRMHDTILWPGQARPSACHALPRPVLSCPVLPSGFQTPIVACHTGRMSISVAAASPASSQSIEF